ncbi:hypothetical protein [Alkalihalobacillus sp. BA299]|uniref:hypothetical protein n=1 Tax=Alkalihalobacillus sp. BA299 TaxID=2815938 RepID=UPI001ADC5470|nr:hypothetical protein [Alkalihalobacillus sp. BA299]
MWGLNKILDIFKEVFEQLYKWLVEPFTDIHTLRDLIFGQDGTEEYVFKTFKENEILNVYVPGVATTTSIAAVFILVGIVLAGIRLGSSGLNPSNRTTLLEFLKDIFIVGIVVANIGTLYEIIFKVNGAIVNVFAGTEDSLADFTTMIESNGAVDGFLGWIVIQLVLLGLALWANFYYMMRKLTLLILMILGPIMMALWLIPQYKGITMGWLKEFTGTVFVQAIHACTFWVVASIAINQNNFIPAVILYVIFIPVAESIRNLFGLGGQMNSTLAKVGAGFGMASLAGMAGSIKGAIGDKSLTSALREAYSGFKNSRDKNSDSKDENGKPTVGGNTGTDTGTTSRAEKMLKAGQITSKAGKAVFGMAGSIAGSPLGPVGAIAGGTAGMLAGGAVGGLSGRIGAATAMGVGNRFKKGFEGAKDEAKKLTDSAGIDDLAESMAQKETDQWISNNKEQLEKDLKERHPTASPSQLKDLYNHDVAQKHKENKQNALETLKNVQGQDGNYANAAELAEESATKLTSAWSDQNRGQFMVDYSKKNPPKANMTDAERLDYENGAIGAWNKKLGEKKQEFLQLANETASDMSNGVDLKHSSINKDDFAGQLASKVNDNEKNQKGKWYVPLNEKGDLVSAHPKFIDSYLKDDNGNVYGYNSARPNDTPIQMDHVKELNKSNVGKYFQHNHLPEELQDKYADVYKQKPPTQKAYHSAIDNATKDKNFSQAELVEKSADAVTDSWKAKNKNNFMSNLSANNPNMTEDEKIVAWDNEVSKRRQQNRSIANATATKMGSNGIDITQNKQDFANQLANDVYDNDRTLMQKDARPSEQQKAYVSAINNATEGVKGQVLMNKGHINKDHFASMMATNMTSKNKEGYINQMMSDGFSEQEASEHWESFGKQRAYADNYGQVKENLSNYAPGKVVIPSTTGGKIFKGVASVAGGTTGFIKGFTGINEISDFIADTKVGKAVIQGATGVATGVALNKLNMTQAVSQAPTMSIAATEVLKGGMGMLVGGASSGIQGMGNSLKEEHVPQNVMERHSNHKNAVAFGSGMLFGVSGYQKGANFGMNHNPYNKLVHQESAEVSEIAQMATRGTVQLVTTDNQSYIQLRDKTGNTQIVSRFGSGDSSLNKGEVVYQDLSVQDGAIVPKMIDGTNSSAYTVDSGGGKIPLNRSINVNPNRLVSNRNVPVQTPPDVQPYDHKVDSGQYHVDDIVTNSQQEIRMITERNRSYVVAKDSRGVEHRISPYGEGDTRLNEGEVLYSDCRVSNKRLKTERVYTLDQVTNEKTDVDIKTHVDPNELIPEKQNPRLNQRNERETLRQPQGV